MIDCRALVLLRTLKDLLADLSDLAQKEIRLAKAEVTATVFSRVKSSVWMIAAASLGLIAVMLAVQAAVFAIASFGLALHWACLLMAAVLAAAGTALYHHGQAVADEQIFPTRTVRQIAKDIQTAKEQLT